MASRTALAISPLLSIKDWLSIALTFTVTCGAGLEPLALTEPAFAAVAALEKPHSVLQCAAYRSSGTLGGGV